MTIPVARLGDRTIGTCYCHDTPITVGGTIVESSTDDFVNNRGAARLGDTILADCGHTCVIITASDVSFVNGIPVARLGDLGGAGCYECTIITASEDQHTA